MRLALPLLLAVVWLPACAANVVDAGSTPTCQNATGQLAASGTKIRMTVTSMNDEVMRTRFGVHDAWTAPDGSYGHAWEVQLDVDALPPGGRSSFSPPSFRLGCKEDELGWHAYDRAQIEKAVSSEVVGKRPVPAAYEMVDAPDSIEIVQVSALDEVPGSTWMKRTFPGLRPGRKLSPEEKQRWREHEQRMQTLMAARRTGIEAENARLAGAQTRGAQVEAYARALAGDCSAGLALDKYSIEVHAAGHCSWISYAPTRDQHSVDGQCRVPDSWEVGGRLLLAEAGHECQVSSAGLVPAAHADPVWRVSEPKLDGWLAFDAKESGPVASASTEGMVSFCEAQWPRDTRTIHCNRPEVHDLTPLTALTQLRALDLSKTGVVDVGPLAALPRLEFLDLSGTAVVDPAPLAKLVALKHLSLAHTSISDASALRPLLAVLDELDLCATGVAGTNFFDDVRFCGRDGLVLGCAMKCGEVTSPLR